MDFDDSDAARGAQIPKVARGFQLHAGARTFWLTGLSGAGKSTLASGLITALREDGIGAYSLDGDIMRSGLCKDLGFSPEARSENIRRIAEVAKLLNHAGLIVIVAAISPLESDRAQARSIVGEDRFFEIYVKADLNTCIGRDPKGLYARALKGEISNFTGISAAYDPPKAPALVIETGKTSLLDSLAQFKSFLMSHTASL